VFQRHKYFKVGQKSLQDDEFKGRPSTSRTEESTEIIQKCLAQDRTSSVRMLEELIGINRETVCKILIEDFKKKKVCVSWYILHENALSHSSGVVSPCYSTFSPDIVQTEFFYFLN
jgi:hypothetical protein